MSEECKRIRNIARGRRESRLEVSPRMSERPSLRPNNLKTCCKYREGTVTLLNCNEVSYITANTSLAL